MLALVSSSSASAIGRFVRLKNVTSCLTPSSKTLKSSAVRSVTYFAGAVGDRHVQRDEIDAGAKRRLRRLACRRRRLLGAADLDGGGDEAGARRARGANENGEATERITGVLCVLVS